MNRKYKSTEIKASNRCPFCLGKSRVISRNAYGHRYRECVECGKRWYTDEVVISVEVTE